MDRIGIIGLGAVGTAVQNGFASKGFEVITYDKATDGNMPLDFTETTIAFVCVPTPNHPDGRQDIQNLLDVLNLLLVSQYKGIVIIKSTILPGTTQQLQNGYPDLHIVCSPEFLDEDTAIDDFLYPDKILIGYTTHNYRFAQRVVGIFRNNWKDVPIRIVPSSVAEMVKYMTNAYYALLITYANQVYDLCESLYIDYETVKNCFLINKNITPVNFEVFYKGKETRGFDGKCLPKDMEALIHFTQDSNIQSPLLETAESINNKLRNS